VNKEVYIKKLINILNDNDKLLTNINGFNDNISPVWWTVEKRLTFTVIKDYILPTSKSPNDSITYTTQATYEFIYHIEELCKRWKGPLSAAIYVPGDDILISLRLITYMRKCRDPCISHNVTWHMVFDSKLGFKDDIPYPDGFFREDEINCESNSYTKIYSTYKSTFRKKHKLLYPINVLRNVARLAAKTKYLLASDIELYPSINIIPMFQELLTRKKQSFENFKSPYVFVLPIFEVKSNVTPPLTKTELRKLFKKGI
jgi:PREDICTED: similar to AGAP009403-PA